MQGPFQGVEPFQNPPGESPEALPEPFRLLLQTLPVAAYVCDEEGLITYFNEQAVRVWGREPKLNDPRDRFCGSFRLHDESGQPLAHEECWMALALRDEKAYEGCRISIEQPGGRRVPVLAYAKPVHDREGKLIGAVNALIDISERLELEGKVREVEKDYADFFEQGSLGLHWVDRDGIIVRANQAELDLLGYEHDEYVGQHIARFHADDDVIEDMLARLAAGETLRNYEARMVAKDGSIKHVAITSNVMWRNGEFIHTRCFTNDISALKRAEAALREADERKNEFLAMLAHELRNPLAPILNAVEYLRTEGPDDPELHRARDIIDRQVAHMARLIDDLLNVARITRGKLQIARTRVALAEIIRNGVETVRPLLEERRHELTLSIPDEALHLDADPVRMSQVVSNLLTNAAKYTPPGGTVRILARPIEDGGSGRTVAVSVEDNGIGIATEHLPRVFEMFAQVGDRPDSKREGLGVGLTLVRSIVEMHGGFVEARSEGEGRGAVFEIKLPLAGSSADSGSDETAADRGSKRRILVVDDHEDSADSLSRLLSARGHTTCTALDAVEALARSEEFRPEVILLDIGLPGMDGYEACRRIRSHSWGREAVIVAVTGWGQREDKRRALEAGFDNHMTKPVKLGELERFLASLR